MMKKVSFQTWHCKIYVNSSHYIENIVVESCYFRRHTFLKIGLVQPFGLYIPDPFLDHFWIISLVYFYRLLSRHDVRVKLLSDYFWWLSRTVMLCVSMNHTLIRPYFQILFFSWREFNLLSIFMNDNNTSKRQIFETYFICFSPYEDVISFVDIKLAVGIVVQWLLERIVIVPEKRNNFKSYNFGLSENDLWHSFFIQF